MNTRTLETYCVNCDKDVNAIVSCNDALLDVRGEQIRYREVALHCPDCGSRISDSRIEDQNLKAVYAEYGQRHQIPLPAEITSLRQRYGLSLREFSKFLGFGEQTVARYERGSLPDESHAYVLRQAQTPQGATSLLEAHGAKLTENSVKKIHEFIQGGISSRTVYELSPFPVSILDGKFPDSPCRTNGYRVFSFDRAGALARLLASKCKNLYKTKLQKAMFYVDALACEKLGNSITGLQYAHGTHGPVIDGMDEMNWRLTGSGILESSEVGWGEIFTPGPTTVDETFSNEELEVIDQVAAFVNSFNTANELSEFSHDLAAWANAENGKPIDYNARHGEIERSILARLNAN